MPISSVLICHNRLEDTAYGASSHLPLKTMKAETASVWNRFIMYLGLNYRFHVKFSTESSVQGVVWKVTNWDGGVFLMVFRVVPSIHPAFQA